MKCAVLVALLVAGVSANAWVNPFAANPHQPILAKLTPAMQQAVPKNIQMSLAKVTPKDVLGLRTIAERLTKQPTSRAEFMKLLSQQAPNVMFLGTEVFKTGRDGYMRSRKSLTPDSVKFMRTVAAETQSAVGEAEKLFKAQDPKTKKNLEAVFPFIPQLIDSSKNSIQYVAKNI